MTFYEPPAPALDRAPAAPRPAAFAPAAPLPAAVLLVPAAPALWMLPAAPAAAATAPAAPTPLLLPAAPTAPTPAAPVPALGAVAATLPALPAPAAAPLEQSHWIKASVATSHTEVPTPPPGHMQFLPGSHVSASSAAASSWLCAVSAPDVEPLFGPQPNCTNAITTRKLTVNGCCRVTCIPRVINPTVVRLCPTTYQSWTARQAPAWESYAELTK
jgi:hypothetical protein